MTNRQRTVYFRVDDTGYPRNSRVRQALGAAGHDVVVVRRRRDRGRWRARAEEFRDLVRQSRGCGTIVVAEFQTAHTLTAWLVSRVRGARLVVDGFVGLVETYVEDFGWYSPGSPRATLLRVLDRIALEVADVYLTDTEQRAAAIRSKRRRLSWCQTTIASLPVGAPDWAQPFPAHVPASTIRLLYYGTYLPLHGLEFVIDGLAACEHRERFVLTLVGASPERVKVEAQAELRGIRHLCQFLDPVSEKELPGLIQEAHVVLGVFGTSAKAGSVIANKVWQGLACNRVVLTRTSNALREISGAVGSRLSTVDPGSARAVARALDEFATTYEWPSGGGIDEASELRTYVAQAFSALPEVISAAGGRRCRRHSRRSVWSAADSAPGRTP